MQVCWRWYDIASPYFFAIVPVRPSHRQSFVKHCRTHPELAAYTKDLYFFNGAWGDSSRDELYLPFTSGPFDVQLLASALPFLTNLTTLVIAGCNDKTDRTLPMKCMTRRHRNPVALQRLTLFACRNTGFILHGLLSLFSVDTLVPAAYCGIYELFDYSKSSKHLNALFAPGSVAVRQLVLQQTDEHFYSFFERVLSPGCVRGLTTGAWVRHDDITHILARFLRSPAGQNLVSVSIGGIELSSLRNPSSWVITVSPENLWACGATLGAALAHCTHLQNLRIGLVHGSELEKDPLSQCSGLWKPLLANLPPTLRALDLHIWVLVSPPWRLWRWASPVKSLAPLDRLLGDSGSAAGPGEGRTPRLPHLKRVELHVHYWYSERSPSDASEMREREEVGLELAAATALPRLSAAGLLKEFRVDDVEGSPDYDCECLLLRSCADFGAVGVRELTMLNNARL